MKLIIDIDENDYEYMKNGYVPHSFNMFMEINYCFKCGHDLTLN